jgi:hypothetical protein
VEVHRQVSVQRKGSHTFLRRQPHLRHSGSSLTSHLRAGYAGGCIQALARQKYWQIRTNFTTLLLHNHNVNSDCKDYSKNLLASLTCLEFL